MSAARRPPRRREPARSSRISPGSSDGARSARRHPNERFPQYIPGGVAIGMATFRTPRITLLAGSAESRRRNGRTQSAYANRRSCMPPRAPSFRRFAGSAAARRRALSSSRHLVFHERNGDHAQLCHDTALTAAEQPEGPGSVIDRTRARSVIGCPPRLVGSRHPTSPVLPASWRRSLSNDRDPSNARPMPPSPDALGSPFSARQPPTRLVGFSSQVAPCGSRPSLSSRRPSRANVLERPSGPPRWTTD
jgi:hypothetical protein